MCARVHAYTQTQTRAGAWNMPPRLHRATMGQPEVLIVTWMSQSSGPNLVAKPLFESTHLFVHVPVAA